MDYPAAVERHFRQPSNVGPLTPGSQRISRGEAGGVAAGAWVVFEADIAGGVLRHLAFRAYGCPYLIAACSLATELLAGAAPQALQRFECATLAEELQVPAGKLGSLLILEDALRNCFRDWDTTQPAGAR
jgi:NifU-like protein involved in Fe-S cluster formation